MSDDLVKRFSTYNVMMSGDGKEVPTPDGKWVKYKDYKTAADRIEELEANLAKAVETERKACANVVKHFYEKGQVTKPDDIINRPTLAELKGQDDE